MRAGARHGGSRAARERRESRPWLVIAAACFGAALVYFYVSVSDAVSHRNHGAGPLLVESGGPDATATPPADRASATRRPVSTATPRSTPTPRPTPRPTPDRGGFPVRPIEDRALLAAIEDAIDGEDEHIAVVAKRLSDGRAAAVNGDRVYYAASTYKLAVLYEAERRRALGELGHEDVLTISDEDLAEDLGTSEALEIGEDGSITVGQLLRPMITLSDNASAVALLHHFGSWNIDDTLRGLGIETMSVNTTELPVTAADLALLMEAIYTGEGLHDEERDFMRGLLLDSTWRRGIPGALAKEVRDGLGVGNKTGTWEGAQHDVAFIEGRRGTYILAILSDGSAEGWEALQRVTRAVYEVLEK